jgi:pseudouridine-5'-phosphate glycosidase
MMHRRALQIAPEVEQALARGRPVVALESTIIAHGMPYPVNVETALGVEQVIREAGAVPATIGILAGRISVGLSAAEIQALATAPNVLKAGERDIAGAVAFGSYAATTAGSSLAIAAAAGIRVFVTGGIGGVGIDAAHDFDVSADLQAIAGYPVITVCAGAKAFMDVPATLEMLETLRVPVAVWRSAEFPLFFARSSGVPAPWQAASGQEVAQVFAAQHGLGILRGLLLAVPVPEDEALPPEATQEAISAALAEAQAKSVSGKALTPFLLSSIARRTSGASLVANIALIRNNARVGALVAAALSLLD